MMHRALNELTHPSGKTRKALFIYGLYIFVGNLVWEFAHMPLYTIWYDGTQTQIISYAIHCILGDVMIALTSLGVALLVFVNQNSWLSSKQTFWRTALLAMGLGLAYTFFSEYLNVEIRQSWTYTEAMPRLPVIGTGLTPILQWLILPGLGFYFLQRKFVTPEQT